MYVQNCFAFLKSWGIWLRCQLSSHIRHITHWLPTTIVTCKYTYTGAHTCRCLATNSMYVVKIRYFRAPPRPTKTAQISEVRCRDHTRDYGHIERRMAYHTLNLFVQRLIPEASKFSGQFHHDRAGSVGCSLVPAVESHSKWRMWLAWWCLACDGGHWRLKVHRGWYLHT